MIKSTACIVAGLLVVGTASAQGFYAGASVGQSKAKFSSAFDADTLSNDAYGVPSRLTRTLDDTDTAYKLTLGYQPNKNFAIEAGYTNLGDANVNYAGVGAAAGDTYSFSYKVDAWTVAGVGILPVADQFSVFGKLGVAVTKLKSNENINLVSIADIETLSESRSRTNVLYGVGVKYDITKNIGVRAEYEDFGRVGDNASAKLSVISVGLDFRF